MCVIIKHKVAVRSTGLSALVLCLWLGLDGYRHYTRHGYVCALLHATNKSIIHTHIHS